MPSTLSSSDLVFPTPCMVLPNSLAPGNCHFFLIAGSGWLIKCLHSNILPVVSSNTAIAWCSGRSVGLNAIVVVDFLL